MNGDGKGQLKVFIMDLLCQTPHYDRYLLEGLRAINPSTTLASITFHLDKKYFTRNGLKNDPGFLDVVARLGIKDKRLRRGLKTLEYILNLLALSVRFFFSRPDVVHVEWMPLLSKARVEIWVLKLFKKLGIKLVFTEHDVRVPDSGKKHSEQHQEVYQIVDALVCHTSEAKGRLVKDYGIPACKAWVIGHGPLFHDTARPSREEARARLGYPDGRPVVLFFGIIRPYKGVEFILDAWAKVIKARPDAVLVIAGHGDPDYINRIASIIKSLGLEGSVSTVFDYVPTGEVAFYHQAADILVYPYRDITQSGALFTGMSFGKPVVATRVGGFTETIQDGRNGLLVECGDADGLAVALVRLMESPEERARLGSAAYADLTSVYSWDAIAKKTLECYRTIINEGARQH